MTNEELLMLRRLRILLMELPPDRALKVLRTVVSEADLFAMLGEAIVEMKLHIDSGEYLGPLAQQMGDLCAGACHGDN